MTYDVFGRSDDWLDGFDAGRRAEKSCFIGFLISEGIISLDKSASLIYDAEKSDQVRLSVLDYINSISSQQRK